MYSEMWQNKISKKIWFFSALKFLLEKVMASLSTNTSENTFKCVINYTNFFSSQKTFPVLFTFRSASNDNSALSVSCFERKSIKEKETSELYIVKYVYSFASIVIHTYTLYSQTNIKFAKYYCKKHL